jgi:hypothetical protein
MQAPVAPIFFRVHPFDALHKPANSAARGVSNLLSQSLLEHREPATLQHRDQHLAQLPIGGERHAHGHSANVPGPEPLALVLGVHVGDEKCSSDATPQAAQVPEHGGRDRGGMVEEQNAGHTIGGGSQARLRGTPAEPLNIDGGIGLRESTHYIGQSGGGTRQPTGRTEGAIVRLQYRE